MANRMVNCVKLGKEAPGLESLPFDGELGQKIFDNVSAEAWNLWKNDVMIKVINEYRLNLIDPEQYNALMEQMTIFLNLNDTEGKMLEVENEERGKS